MMSTASYQSLALGWHPKSERDHTFNIISIVIVSVMLAIGGIFSAIDVPKEERKARTVVPERVARFILQKEKKKVIKPKIEPKPKPKPQRIVKKREDKKAKPLNKNQKKARKKAEKTGLLALGKELSDLMDTSSINTMVGRKVRKNVKTTATKVNTDALTSNATKDSGGVSQDKYATSVSSTNLSLGERKAIRQALASGSIDAVDRSKGNQRRGDHLRSEEDITFVMDQNKSQLHSIYRRARRKSPGLKGKIVFMITIAPNGSVSAVVVKSSELNNPSLESRLIARIKRFNFGQRNVEKVTVTFPIEFLPS
ncbi:MAG: AgmX/PglI C-terminal domain-containing protein [Gammaproteobacteria bacterium]|nr:AgmX/PglI C-terminal domain-containing protein [Gammaproteobacteria bacterium]MDH5777777.1 AgmX/PglI C-terminal domain-containing protein [Gammaproteobacteria bacterium]